MLGTKYRLILRVTNTSLLSWIPQALSAIYDLMIETAEHMKAVVISRIFHSTYDQ